MGIPPDEYEELPSWQQDLIAEGIAEKYSDGETGHPPYTGDPGEAASLDDLAGLGMNVRSIS